MNNPTISVIVPVYNTEKYLHRCIDSILAQTFTDFELLLINDGSTDGSGAICDEYALKDNRIRVFHKKNGGVSSARNVGLKEMRGEWVTFADSDDRVNANWLSLYESNLNLGSTLLVQGIDYSKEENRYKYYHIGVDYFGNIKDGLLALPDYMFGSPVNKLFNSSIIDNNNIRFDERFKFREDEDFMLKYCRYISKMLSISAAAYIYDAPNLINKYQTDNYYCVCSIFNSLDIIYSSQINKLLSFNLRSLLNAYFNSFDINRGNYVDRTRLLIKSIIGYENMLPISNLSTVLINNIKNPIVLATVFYIKSRVMQLTKITRK